MVDVAPLSRRCPGRPAPERRRGAGESPCARSRPGAAPARGWAAAVALVLPLLFAAGVARAQWPPLEPVLRTAWEDGLTFERQERLRESTERYELLARALPDSATIRWRLARNMWRIGERLPLDDKQGRMEAFTEAERWADESLRLDPRCGECVLWKIAAMGRIATTGNVVEAASKAKEIGKLIERGIALHPSHVDSDRNQTLANLYYAGAAFYRVVPDWFWLQYVIGVRGDNHRALQYIDHAIQITGDRLDYEVERGAVLLCIGNDESDPQRIAEGVATLERAVELENFQSTDSYDRQHAHILMEHPERACGYSRDGWIDLAKAAR